MSISVVIPTYNGSRFIAETLESVFSQTLQPDEVLVIDDGSTDDSAAIAESYMPRVQVYRSSNQGQAAARNLGIQKATSEWVAFLDHDDLWESSKLQRQMEEITRHLDADLCYTGRVLLHLQGDALTRGKAIYAPPAKDIRKSLLADCTFFPSAVLVRRSTLLAVGGFDPKCHISEDYDLWLRLLHSGAKFVACPEPLLLYRCHEGNSSKKLVTHQACMEVYRRRVLPYLPKYTRWITYNKYQSAIEVNVAYTMREQGNPAHLAMMARSLIHWPFNDKHRYKALIHMLYTRFNNILRNMLS